MIALVVGVREIKDEEGREKELRSARGSKGFWVWAILGDGRLGDFLGDGRLSDP
jgi:hypothetical protein